MPPDPPIRGWSTCNPPFVLVWIRPCLMYPVYVYSFTTAVTLQTQCTYMGLPGEPTQKSGSENLAAAPPHKAATPPSPIKSTSIFKAYFGTSRVISLAPREHKSSRWLSHLQSPIHKRAPGGNIRTQVSVKVVFT